MLNYVYLDTPLEIEQSTDILSFMHTMISGNVNARFALRPNKFVT